MHSRTYGINVIITERDCDARAVYIPNKQKYKASLPTHLLHVPRCFAVIFFNPADRIAPAPRTT